MLKVFLVEDEYIVRNGIKNNIPWEEKGYEFCGEAADGEIALSMIRSTKPDIVITDIRMPFMNGLELTKIIRRELPDTEVIILTGYGEFEYAKEGIRLGVAEYLLKPVNADDLLSVIDSLADKISEKKKFALLQDRYDQDMEESNRQKRREFFYHLVTGDYSVTEILDRGSELGMDLSAGCYNMILLSVQSDAHASEEFSRKINKISAELEQLEQDERAILFDRDLDGKAILLKADSEEELSSYMESETKRITEILQGHSGIHYFGGIGSCVRRLSEIPQSWKDACLAFSHRYLSEENIILDSKTLKMSPETAREEAVVSSIDPSVFDRTKVRNFLRQGNPCEAEFFVQEFVKETIGEAMESTIIRQYVLMDVFFVVTAFLDEIGVGREVITEDESMSPLVAQQNPAPQAYIQRLLEKAMELRDRAAGDRYGDVVEKAKEYISKNYADPEISLESLAAYVNFSPNHLSMVFSKKTGQTFIKYLTEYRIGKAKELLRCTGKRSSEIALETGYQDPHYFSYVFKKTEGMTPTQYRNGQE